MGSTSAGALLQLRIELNGIYLGRPTDLLLDVVSWHVLGFVVHCGDESARFLPYAAAQPSAERIAVGSALMLLEDVGFYEQRGVSFRSLLDGRVGPNGVLRDLRIGPGGAVTELEVERDGTIERVPAAGLAVSPTRLSAA
ncbi:MAG TPA: hypothetical protein VFA24_05315 [Gaiellaceae bacterium]|nr:hypothetical protein [Gaiellaceae bacterium]